MEQTFKYLVYERKSKELKQLKTKRSLYTYVKGFDFSKATSNFDSFIANNFLVYSANGGAEIVLLSEEDTKEIIRQAKLS